MLTTIRIALADDHPIVLAGIKALLQTAPEFTLVGVASTGTAALQLIRETRPDIAVLDVSMPAPSGLDLARRIAADWPEVKVLALTVHEDRAYVRQLLQAGARGYVVKRSAAEDLVRAVRAVADGGLYLDPAIASSALPETPAADAARSDRHALSKRERAVLELTAFGFAPKEIAARLDISIKTVETYKARATDKLGLRTRADIVRYGAAQGWLQRLASA